jgi:hypothetical protein
LKLALTSAVKYQFKPIKYIGKTILEAKVVDSVGSWVAPIILTVQGGWPKPNSMSMLEV